MTRNPRRYCSDGSPTHLVSDNGGSGTLTCVKCGATWPDDAVVDPEYLRLLALERDVPGFEVVS